MTAGMYEIAWVSLWSSLGGLVSSTIKVWLITPELWYVGKRDVKSNYKGPVLVYYTNYPFFSSFMNLTETHMIM